jgi:AraC-like DNA-binding protein
MVYDRQITIMEMPQLIFSKQTSIKISREAELYWKRTWDYTCENRMIDVHEISYIKAGEITGTIDDQPVVLKAGDLFWMNARTPHSLQWPKDLIYYTLRFSIFNNSSEMVFDKPVFILENNSDIEFIFRNLTVCIKAPSKTLFKEEKIKAFLNLLAIHVANNYFKKHNMSSIREFSHLEKDSILQFCSAYRYQNIVSSDIADHLNLTKDYFSRLFKNTFGRSVRSWLFEEKMKYAARLLIDTSLNLQRVAEEIGYDDYYLFSRQFKKVMGLSPKKYRKDSVIH